MKRNTHTGGLLGTGSHIEYHRAPSKNSSKKRNRKNCPYYDAGSNFCKKLKIRCTGYSNPLCPKNTQPVTSKKSSVGAGKQDANKSIPRASSKTLITAVNVYSLTHGFGRITKKTSSGAFVKWTNKDREEFIDEKEIRKMLARYSQKFETYKG